jgi:hypothetical protein
MSVSTAAICALTRALIETLLTLGRFEASMMLHEDYEGIGAYLYELNDPLDPGLGAKIIAAMGLHVLADLRPEIEGKGRARRCHLAARSHRQTGPA